MAKRANMVEEITHEQAVTNSVNAMVEQVVAETSGPEVDANGRKKKVNLSYEELEAQCLKNKSQIIRYLDAEGYSRSAIALFLNVRYQHVRNVLVTPLKKG